MVDNAIFYLPKQVDDKILTKLKTLPKSLCEFLNDVALYDNIPATQMEFSFKEWYINRGLVPNRSDRVSKLFFFDTETNSLNGYMVSVGAILYDLEEDRVLDSFYSLVNPMEKIDLGAEAIHHISDSMVCKAPKFKDIYPKIREMLDASEMVVAYNAEYDIGVLIRECEREGVVFNPFHWLDPMARLKKEVQAKNENGRLKNPKLMEAAKYFGVEYKEGELHNALYDTEVLLQLFRNACKKYDSE